MPVRYWRWCGRCAGRPGEGVRPVAKHGLTVGSALVAIGIGAPSFTQIESMAGLPASVMWPVIASVLAWAMLVATLWLFCLGSDAGRPAMMRVRRRAIGVAVLVTVPKLIILTWV
ncbi:hypothetical protein ACFSGX_06680 [Sphingomonas arantia]|uniref:Uncharacterized protein n=1 Tax=Sphingomonas arantia TaxID=1460676 RepID=A0ABW4TUS1_9SPHN